MSLEQKIEDLTVAVAALTAKISGATVATATEGKADAKVEKKTEKTEKKVAAYEPKHTAEEMQAAMNTVREKLGMPAAKEMRAAHTKAEKISQVTDPKEIDALYAAATAALEAAEQEDV